MRVSGWGGAHAALFWAFRRDCAGVRMSFSTLFDRLSCLGEVSLSISRAMPLSIEPLLRSCWLGGEAELELFGTPGRLSLAPMVVSKA